MKIEFHYTDTITGAGEQRDLWFVKFHLKGGQTTEAVLVNHYTADLVRKAAQRSTRVRDQQLHLVGVRATPLIQPVEIQVEIDSISACEIGYHPVIGWTYTAPGGETFEYGVAEPASNSVSEGEPVQHFQMHTDARCGNTPESCVCGALTTQPS